MTPITTSSCGMGADVATARQFAAIAMGSPVRILWRRDLLQRTVCNFCPPTCGVDWWRLWTKFDFKIPSCCSCEAGLWCPTCSQCAVIHDKYLTKGLNNWDLECDQRTHRFNVELAFVIALVIVIKLCLVIS